MKKIKTVFFGSSHFSAAVLEKLLSDGADLFDVVAVVTRPDAPTGRKKVLSENPLKAYAGEKGLPCYPHNADLVKKLQETGIELCLVAAYGRILKTTLLDSVSLGFWNIHGSYLPELRGAVPIQLAIARGNKETGVSVIQMDSGMDTGMLLAKSNIPIEDDDTFASLAVKMAEEGTKLFIQELPKYIGKEMTLSKQEGEPSYCYIRDLESLFALSIEANTAYEIESAVRALLPYDHIPFVIKGTRVLLYAVKALSNDIDLLVGETAIVSGESGKSLVVACREGLLQLDALRPPGKGTMRGTDFNNGYIKK